MAANTKPTQNGAPVLQFVRNDQRPESLTNDSQEIQAVSEARQAGLKLHILVNNAGSASPKREVTEDGIERTFAVNRLAPFLLTNLLLDLLKRSAPAKVINVASIEHRQGTLRFDNLQFEQGGYGVVRAYARSKLANVLFTMELARRLAGTGVTANCLDPGAVATNIWSHGPGYVRLVFAVARLFMLSAEQGADPIVQLAVSSEVEGLTGGYYERNRKVTPSPLARDHAIAKRLWDRSAALVGLSPDAHDTVQTHLNPKCTCVEVAFSAQHSSPAES